jgi:hypothetical protein
MGRISEALYGIRVCKLFAWEPDFADAIGKVFPSCLFLCVFFAFCVVGGGGLGVLLLKRAC